MDKLIPKSGNDGKGFHYTVSDEQIAAYAKWTLEEKIEWLEQTAKFADVYLTTDERDLIFNIGNKIILERKTFSE